MSSCRIQKWASTTKSTEGKTEKFHWSCTNHGVQQATKDSRAARDQAAADHEKHHNPR